MPYQLLAPLREDVRKTTANSKTIDRHTWERNVGDTIPINSDTLLAVAIILMGASALLSGMTRGPSRDDSRQLIFKSRLRRVARSQ